MPDFRVLCPSKTAAAIVRDVCLRLGAGCSETGLPLLVQCRPSDVCLERPDGAGQYADWCIDLARTDAILLDYAELQRDPEAVLWDFAKRFNLDAQLVGLAVAAVKSPALAGELFTIAVIVHRREWLLAHALETLVWQTYPHWEAQVFADGPHPASNKLVQQLQTRSEFAGRLSYHELPVRPGANGNHLRRAGRDAASGKYLAYLSHDCLLHPDFLQAHVNNFHRGASLSVVGASCWSANPTDDLLECPDIEINARQPSAFQGYLPQADPEHVIEGQVRLVNLAVLTELARYCDIFPATSERQTAADFLAFDTLRSGGPLGYDSRVLAARF